MEATRTMSRVAMTSSEKLVVFASSLGTVFEWYDFLIVGALAAEISKHFFSSVNPAAAFIFTLLSFAAGFAVRPLGAIVFGRVGDLAGRKYTFLITIVLMGFATFAIGPAARLCFDRYCSARRVRRLAHAARAGDRR